MIQALIAPVSSLLDKVIPDADERARLSHEIATLATRQAHGIFAGSCPEQIQGHMFDGGEVSRSVIGADSAFVVPQYHVHDPMQRILDGPVIADNAPCLLG